MSTVYNGVILEEISVDVSQPNDFAPKFVKQGDAYTRGYVATITQNGVKLDVQTSGVTVYFNCCNQTDKTKKASLMGTVNSNGTVTVIVPEVVMEVEGYIYCDISIISASGGDTHILKTTLFVLLCEKAANKDMTTSEAEDNLLAGILAGTIHIPGITGGMAFAPINPSASEIASLPVGQLYSDDVNHQAGIVTGSGTAQLFYDKNNIDAKLALKTNKSTKVAGISLENDILSEDLADALYDDLGIEDYASLQNVGAGPTISDLKTVIKGQYYYSSERKVIGVKLSEATPMSGPTPEYIEAYSTEAIDTMIGDIASALDILNENLSEV